MKYVSIELPENFEKGDCYNCPFQYFEVNGFDGCDSRCIFSCRPIECPLEIKILNLHEEVLGRLVNEYISKVNCCDECFASVYCTVNGLRESRLPQDYCIENIKKYFEGKESS